MSEFHFTAPLYLWEARTDSWVFTDLPFDIADVIEDRQSGPRRGFGAVRVQVEVGSTRWRTSIFPSKERRTYVLPVKRAVLKAESLVPGDAVTVRITLVD